MEEYTKQFFANFIDKCKECMDEYQKTVDPSTLPRDSFKCHRISVARCFPCMFQHLENLYDEEAPAETQHFWMRMVKKCINCMLDSVEKSLPKLEEQRAV